MTEVSKRKFIIDCDTGVDDAVAIFMALDSPDVDLLAITVVDGNCSLEKAVGNTLKVLKLAQMTVPVYSGCSKGLSTNGLKSDVIHGDDGLGGIAHEYQACGESLRPGHASQALIELVNKYPGEITLVAMGPLTNLALAYRLDDSFSSKLHKLVIMGGNTEGKGNARLGAEFNFACDPVAAQIVLEDTKCHCQICGWELCGLKHAFSWEWFDKWTSGFSSDRGEFMSKIVKPFSIIRRKRWPELGFAICDPLAMSVAIQPDIVTQSTWQKVTVETSSPHCSGLMIPEWREGLFPRDTKKHELILAIDSESHTENMDKLMLK